MNTLKKLIAAFVLVFGLAAINPAQAGIPTIDVTAIAQAIEQVKAWGEQFAQMAKQLEEMERAFDNQNGVRNMGNLVNDPESRKYLPDDYQTLLDNGVGSWEAIREANRVYDISNTGLSPDSDTYKEYEQSEKQSAINRASAEEAYKSATQRFDDLQVLLDKVNDAPDAKDIADLQARIQIEQAMLQNEANKLQALAQLTAAQQNLEHQRLKQLHMKSTRGEKAVWR
ncbi:MAG: P-type DNA transfer protein VirB5 [Candidatus Accumulibacter sp.]|nr:P-type DNA transfer protein VirB5 [Accumulibacter sp.]